MARAASPSPLLAVCVLALGTARAGDPCKGTYVSEEWEGEVEISDLARDGEPAAAALCHHSHITPRKHRLPRAQATT